MPRNAFCSLANFIRGFLVIFIPNWFQKYSSYGGAFTIPYAIIVGLFVLAVAGYLKLKYDECKFQIAIRSYFLGAVFSCGAFTLLCSIKGGSPISAPSLTIPIASCSLYAMCLSIFHWTEYAVFATVNEQSATVDSFLLDHSSAYKFALMASIIEYAVELYFFPGIKAYLFFTLIGLVIVLCGDVLRKLSMITASVNFDHYIQYTKRPGHKLVTNGVYAWSRHPSYVGWFYWSIGTQILLANPFCLIGYTLAGLQFFRVRIESEERTLLKFFGIEYHQYQKRVPIRLPYVEGFDSRYIFPDQ